MLNFTGSTKKRVVNLGDNRGGNRGRSFLEQAKKDRQEREKGRQRERCAIVLQSYVRRCLCLRESASEVSRGWSKRDSNQNPTLWCAEASFIVRFGSSMLLDSIYPEIYRGIDHSDGSFSYENVFVLVKALNAGLTRGVSPGLALNCLLRLFALYPVPRDHKSAFKSFIKNIMKYATHNDMPRAIQLIFQVNSADSPEAFVGFLATAPRSVFSESSEYSAVISSVLCDEKALFAIMSLSGKEQVSLLVNVLILNSSSLGASELLTHARVLSKINAGIVPIKEDETMSENASPYKVTVCSEDYKVLSTLLSSNYIRLIFKHLKQLDTNLCVQTMSQLLHLFPESRTTVCMIMSITPELPNWIYHLASTNRQYNNYLSIEGKAIPFTPEFFNSSVNSELSFEEIIYTYNQILSSWLVVSKDTESFRKESFPLKDIKTYCRFLKSFCFSLIKDARGGDFQKVNDLKEISISVLNQLYIKNLRLQFLPKLSWKVEGLELHSRNVILESDQEEGDYSSDEDGAENSAFDNQTMRRPSFRKGSQEAFELEVLNKVPFFVDFTTRVKILQNSIQADKTKYGSDPNAFFFSDDVNSHKLAADISRDTVLDDAFESFFRSGENFKNQLKVTFHNEHGPEAGIDGGGLTKEFLTSVVDEGFSPNCELALFKESSSYNLYPNDDIFWKTIKQIDLPTQRKRLMYTKFLGMIIGKCLYEGILIDVSFAPSFLSKWRVAQNNSKNSIDDLVFLDPELYANLNKLLDMNEEQLQALDLSFTIDEVVENKTLSFDLQPPNGAHETVTVSNRLSYIHKVSHFKLNQSLHLQTKNFLEGLFQLVRPSWLNMFDPLEIQMLISGGHDIDLNDWKSNVQYGGYFDDDVTVNLFWEVVEEMTPQERCDLVKFVTSVSRAPLLGFGVMYPKFGISHGGSPDRLPTASTCLNLLKLPDYREKSLIRQKLLYSIYANSGFDLS